MICRAARLSRRSALSLAGALPLAMIAEPSLAQSGPIVLTDVLGRTVALNGPAERIVLGFNYEEFTAIAGPAGSTDRVCDGWERRLRQHNMATVDPHVSFTPT